MIYILSILFILFLVLRYDIKGHTSRKTYFYKILLIWFILVSGLAYNVGADVPGYMEQYDEFNWSEIHSLSDLSKYRHRQPGWVAVNLLCKLFTDNFVLFKLVEAIFVNVVIFRFIKRYCPYIFTGILLYAVMLYLQLNFNALRQAYALGFFLLGFDYLVQKKFWKYYLFALLALMFHSSAMLCLALPIVTFVRLTSKSIIIILSGVFVFFIMARSFFLENAMNLFFNLTMNNGQLAEEYGELGGKFMGEKYMNDGGITLFGYIETALQLGFVFLMVLINNRKGNRINPLIGIMTVIDIIFLLLNSFIPVLFYRLMYYVQLFYIITITAFCINACKTFLPKYAPILSLSLILYFCYSPIKGLYLINPRSDMPDLVQFYPYSSIFDKTIYPPRAAEWGWHK